MKFQGVMTAIVTPMQDGSIDEAGLRDLVRKQIDSGVTGIVACGSTGEGVTLTDEEQAHVVRVAVEAAGGRCPVIAGVGARSTIGAIDQARSAAAAGADALLVVTPAYNKPTQGGLEAHFRAVADAVPIPVIASGGVGTLAHLRDGVTQGHASAVLAASIFHFGTYSIGEAKDFLQNQGVAVRLEDKEQAS